MPIKHMCDYCGDEEVIHGFDASVKEVTVKNYDVVCEECGENICEACGGKERKCYECRAK